MLDGHVYTVPDGVRGFDADTTITPSVARAFRAHGYRFAVRYVRREPFHASDLTASEATGLLDAGLGIMPVQHVEPGVWHPSAEKGSTYGSTAAAEAERIGIPPGVIVWCDLESVDAGTPADAVIEYCNEWHIAVAKGGFVPGLYVGYDPGLNSTQLYRSLRFTPFWGAYNLNSDQVPAVRGFQMQQAVRRSADVVSGVTLDFDVDTVRADNLGGRPTLLGPEFWLEQL
jgi:hypothetical protein